VVVVLAPVSDQDPRVVALGETVRPAIWHAWRSETPQAVAPHRDRVTPAGRADQFPLAISSARRSPAPWSATIWLSQASRARALSSAWRRPSSRPTGCASDDRCPSRSPAPWRPRGSSCPRQHPFGLAHLANHLLWRVPASLQRPVLLAHRHGRKRSNFGVTPWQLLPGRGGERALGRPDRVSLPRGGRGGHRARRRDRQPRGQPFLAACAWGAGTGRGPSGDGAPKSLPGGGAVRNRTEIERVYAATTAAWARRLVNDR
jgi:hypothetical protein